MALKWEDQHLQPPASPAEVCMQSHEQTAILRHCTFQKFWKNLLMMLLSILTLFHQNIKFTINQESNGELAFLDSLLKRNNGKISVLVYAKPTHTDQYLRYSSHHNTSFEESVLSFLFNGAYSIITNKDDLNKENTRIKQLLKENGYLERMINNVFKRSTNNHRLYQPQQKPKSQISERKKSECYLFIYLFILFYLTLTSFHFTMK